MSKEQGVLDVSQHRSDYGDVSLDLCDKGLRQSVVESITVARQEGAKPIDPARVVEIAAYINRLEDALLRHHWGMLKEGEILDHLKKCSGLDIRALAYSLESMLAEDA